MHEVCGKVSEFVTYQSVWDVNDIQADTRWLLDRLSKAKKPEQHTFSALKERMCGSIDRICSGLSEITIPLSVGLDSRFIYGCARECFETTKIRAVTFGQPGNYEYDFSQHLFRKSVKNHERIDFSNYNWDTATVVGLLSANRNPVVWHWPPSMAECGANVLHGFMGDPLAGSRLPKTPSSNIEKAVAHFHKKSHSDLSQKLSFGCDLDRLNSLFDIGEVNTSRSDLDLVVDYSLRQQHRIRPWFVENSVGAFYPFLDNDIIEFMWTIDPSLRADEQWYIRSLSNQFPDLYWEFNLLGLKKKSQYARLVSGWQRLSKLVIPGRKASRLMYDWSRELMCNASLRKMVCIALEGLSNRAITHPFDTSKLLHKLNSLDEVYIKAHSQHYQTVTFLELNIKAGLLETN